MDLRPSSDVARERGKREYYLRRGEYRNPYPVGSDEYNDYERGWTQSLKMDDARLVTLAQKAQAPTPRPPAPSSDYNAYAELKGRGAPRK